VDYLKLFNVGQVIFASEEARTQVRKNRKHYQFQEKIPYSDYEIWKVRESAGSYVQILKESPEYIEPDNYRQKFYRWFRSYQQDERFLYTVPTAFAGVHGIDTIPAPRPAGETTTEAIQCEVSETVEMESVQFKTNCIGQPHLIKIAYNPGWKVKGAEGPYLASPAYLLVYPTDTEVQLYYDNSGPRRVGIVMTGLGILLLSLVIAIAIAPYGRRKLLWERYCSFFNNPETNRTAYKLFLLLIALFLGVIGYHLSTPQYQSSFKKVERSYTAKDYKVAQRGFSEIIERWGEEPTIDRVHYFLGLSYFLDKDFVKAEESFQEILRYSDSEYLAEAHYHIGICAQAGERYEEARNRFSYVITVLADPIWSVHAKARLKEVPH
jgi:tetratricopeptide (TPR) repeat protein